ncbi:MAG: type 2 isopentenyl-diphosphate Delta-isomerase [Planctomycetales bacterium]|nr:type 2 isopentenyl-diphosphate Delta-isomerase [bacterium]UNM08972.1 MAG: type 2 isopentenyl-diphosphate Delta-isomerase [Planctomycetales bacterium]
MSDTGIEKRKAEHLRLVREDSVLHSKPTLLSDIRLVHQALPELNLSDIDTTASLFGKPLKLPLMITGMTGGTEYAGELNRGLAALAADQGIAFAVGSQRVLWRHEHLLADFAVRDIIGEGVLLGNIGAAQLLHEPMDRIVALVSMIEADGLCLHLNPAQELVQEEGDREFRGVCEKITELNERLDGRLLVKETGAGLSPETLIKLRSSGVDCVDVSGSGGTSWTRVEQQRAVSERSQRLGRSIGDWGVPTAFSIIAARSVLGEQATVIGSGGIRDGLDVARVLAAGGNIAGFARSVLLQFMDHGAEGAAQWVEQLGEELRSVMLLCGARNCNELMHVPRVYTGELKDWLAAYGWPGQGRT